jgi:hypothetical protein
VQPARRLRRADSFARKFASAVSPRAGSRVNLRRMLKKILLGLAVIFVVLQFIRPAKNISLAPPAKEDFLVAHSPPPELRHLIQVACYDCHSNNTHYPWYAGIQPVGWWLANHIDDGVDHLDLSHFGDYSEKKQGYRLDAMIDEITNRTMPLKSYTWIHRDARLSDDQVKRLADWLQAERDKLPADE